MTGWVSPARAARLATRRAARSAGERAAADRVLRFLVAAELDFCRLNYAVIDQPAHRSAVSYWFIFFLHFSVFFFSRT